MGNHIERLDPRLLFAAGDLDPTYGIAGTVTHTLPASLPYPQVAIQGGIACCSRGRTTVRLQACLR
jgi:hypothetical protein